MPAVEFHRTGLDQDWAFVRGAARILVGDKSLDFPQNLQEIIEVESTDPQLLFDAQYGWSDLGATKDGIQIQYSASLGPYEIDKATGNVVQQPENWACSVTTNLAEMILENFQLAWEGSSIETDATPTTDERSMGVGTFSRRTERMLAVLFKKDIVTVDTSYENLYPSDSLYPSDDLFPVSTLTDQGIYLIRGFVFRRAYLSNNQGQIDYVKTGGQQTLPITFDIKPDMSEVDVKKRFFSIIQQDRD